MSKGKWYLVVGIRKSRKATKTSQDYVIMAVADEDKNKFDVWEDTEFKLKEIEDIKTDDEKPDEDTAVKRQAWWTRRMQQEEEKRQKKNQRESERKARKKQRRELDLNQTSDDRPSKKQKNETGVFESEVERAEPNSANEISENLAQRLEELTQKLEEVAEDLKENVLNVKKLEKTLVKELEKIQNQALTQALKFVTEILHAKNQ